MAKMFIGYCRYHNVNLSFRQMRRKGCLNKKNTGDTCTHFKQNTQHPWWGDRENKRASGKGLDQKSR